MPTSLHEPVPFPPQQQQFPVFEHDTERPLHRASQAMVPIMELLYQKAFSVYDSIYHPSISTFDRKFRVQNAIRLLKYVLANITVVVHLFVIVVIVVVV